MRVAIITSFSYHLECIGFLLELFDGCDVYFISDPYKYIEYYMQIYDFKTYKLSSFDERNYECIIKLSSNDGCIKQSSKILSILHSKEYENNMTRFITLSNNVITQYPHQYIFPYYRGMSVGVFHAKTIVFIGHFFPQMYTNDIETFICNANYKFIFCVQNDTVGTQRLAKLYNVTIHIQCDTLQLSQILNSASFILVRNYPPYNDRFSGAISLGISNRIPIICPNVLSNEVPSICFKDNYTEILDTLNCMTQSEYNIECAKIDEFIGRIQMINNINIKSLLYKHDMFDYLIDKINEAEIILEPFPHLDIHGFLSKEHLNMILNDKQIHFEKKQTNDELYNYLIQNGWEIQQFPGCVSKWTDYKAHLNKNFDSQNPVEGVGITFRLKQYDNDHIKQLINFMNGDRFHTALKNKFGVNDETSITTAIQKNLTKYEISPHPDIRQKCLTYLLNINKDDNFQNEDCHTHLLKFKPEYSYIPKYWVDNVNIDRCWLPWDWCETAKQINTNNTIVIFKPSSDPPTLHAIKMNYDHLPHQRTQVYGNLMFKNPVKTYPSNYKLIEK